MHLRPIPFPGLSFWLDRTTTRAFFLDIIANRQTRKGRVECMLLDRAQGA
jgi:hypothetical protein